MISLQDFEIKKIKPDGDCCFNAVFEAAKAAGVAIPPEIRNYQDLRVAACNLLEQQIAAEGEDWVLNIVQPLVDIFNDRFFDDYNYIYTLPEYIKKMKEPGVWGGQLELIMLSGLLGVKIILHYKNQPDIHEVGLDYHNKEIHLLTDGETHFDYLTRRIVAMAKSTGPGIPKPPQPPVGGPPAGGPPPPPPPAGGKAKLPTEKDLLARVNKLKLGDLFPGEDILKRANLPLAQAAQEIPKTPEGKKEAKACEEAIIKVITKLIQDLYKLDKDIQEKHLEEINKKLTKFQHASSGLIACYDFLIAKEVEWKLDAQKKKIAQTPEYQRKEGIAKILNSRYDRVYKEYKALKGDAGKQAKEAELGEIIAEFDKLRDMIPDHSKELKHVEEELAKLEKAAAARQYETDTQIKQKEQEVKQLRNLIQRGLDPDNEFVGIAKGLEGKIKLLKLPIPERIKLERELAEEMGDDPDDDPLVKQLEELQKTIEINEAKVKAAKEQHEKIEDAERHSKVLRDLFKHPESWRKIGLKGGQKGKAAAAVARKAEGFIITVTPTGQEQLNVDLRFLNIEERRNLARFFASSPQEFGEFMNGEEGLQELMLMVNGAINTNFEINYKFLMRIAKGEIHRDRNKFVASPKAIMKDVIRPPEEEDEQKKNEQDAQIDKDNELYLGRSRLFYNHDDKNAFILLNAGRGLEIKNPGNKYFHYQRTMDISYFNDAQMLNLVNFFSRKQGEFLKGGKPDLELMTAHVNTLFQNTEMTFEDLFDIASGHLVRKAGKAGPDDLSFTLLKDIERKGKKPDYQDATDQRAEYELKKKLAAPQSTAALGANAPTAGAAAAPPLSPRSSAPSLLASSGGAGGANVQGLLARIRQLEAELEQKDRLLTQGHQPPETPIAIIQKEGIMGFELAYDRYKAINGKKPEYADMMQWSKVLPKSEQPKLRAFIANKASGK